MSELEDDIRNEVEDVHRFFVAWFTGAAAEADLDTVFVPRLDEQVFFISPDGRRLARDGLLAMFRGAHGNNPDFRIAIRDVKILRDVGDHLVVTYTEWQKGAKTSRQSDNARFTTLLITKAQPFRWLHIHETWLPDAERAKGSFDF